MQEVNDSQTNEYLIMESGLDVSTLKTNKRILFGGLMIFVLCALHSLWAGLVSRTWSPGDWYWQFGFCLACGLLVLASIRNYDRVVLNARLSGADRILISTFGGEVVEHAAVIAQTIPRYMWLGQVRQVVGYFPTHYLSLPAGTVVASHKNLLTLVDFCKSRHSDPA
jgi:hypothetical protein